MAERVVLVLGLGEVVGEARVGGEVVGGREAPRGAKASFGGQRGEGEAVVEGAGVEGARRQGAGEAVLHRQLLLDEVGQGLAGDVEGVEAQVVVLLLLGGAEAEGRLPVRGGGHGDGI